MFYSFRLFLVILLVFRFIENWFSGCKNRKRFNKNLRQIKCSLLFPLKNGFFFLAVWLINVQCTDSMIFHVIHDYRGAIVFF